MRPKICVPIVASLRDQIMREAGEISRLPVQMAEWRVDYYAGYERELPGIVEELKNVLGDKELIVTLRTEYEGGEPNGSRFDYFGMLEEVLGQGRADYIDAEISRDSERLTALCRRYKESPTGIIGSYHDFHKTPSKEFIVQMVEKAKQCGCTVGKFACMPARPEDVDTLLAATAECKERKPEFPVITMSMGEMGVNSRLYGGLYGSEVSFGCAGQASAPGQVSYESMIEVFDKIYVNGKHIFLIGFMGTGKSTVSKELQYRSGKPEVDTDAWIEEQEGRSIQEIFETEGEEYFRQRETAMLDELGVMRPSVISCGGGMALRDLNVRKMKALGKVVLLTAAPEAVYERVKVSGTRPLLRDHMNVDYIKGLMEKRMPFYERAADINVATDNRMICDIAKEILERVQPGVTRMI